MNTNEIWKEIPGYEGYYEVSNFGNFRSIRRLIKYKKNGLRVYPSKTLLTETTKDNYQRIVLMKNGIKKRFMCHRLVAITFIPNVNNKPCVNHIDGNKSNNNVTNLEWVTSKENAIHAFKNNLSHKHYINSTNVKLKCIETNEIFISAKDASRKLKLDYTNLLRNIKKSNSYKNYHFVIM